jgi:hypothetical protein
MRLLSLGSRTRTDLTIILDQMGDPNHSKAPVPERVNTDPFQSHLFGSFRRALSSTAVKWPVIDMNTLTTLPTTSTSCG